MGLFDFESTATPPPGHKLRTPMLSLRIEGWIRLALLGVAIFWFFFELVLRGTMGAFFVAPIFLIFFLLRNLLVVANIFFFFSVNRTVRWISEGTPPEDSGLRTHAILSVIFSSIGVMLSMMGSFVGGLAYAGLLGLAIWQLATLGQAEQKGAWYERYE